MLAIVTQQSLALNFGAKSVPKPSTAAFSATSLPGNWNALGGGEVIPGGVWDPVRTSPTAAAPCAPESRQPDTARIADKAYRCATLACAGRLHPG
jgi:hypothetical protein